MSINKKEIFKTVPIKGKGKGTIEVCNYDNKIIIQPNDKNASSKVDACYDKKPKVQNVLIGVQTLQAPDNDWMVTEDTNYYKVPDNQNGTVTKQQGKALGRISRVRANLVFVRYQGTLRKMLKMDKNAPYNYIDASAAIPYYQYVLKNKPQFQIDPKGYEMIAWAEGVDKKVKGGQLSFDGDDSSFTGNTDLDLSFDGNTALDLSFAGNTDLDLGFDGEESGADGEYFYIVKPKTKILVKDKKTGIIHNSKKKLGRGSKVKGKVITGVHKFRAKNKKTGTISTINKASGYVIIGENDLAQMLVPVGSIRPINMSGFDGNTNLDLGFDGNTNIDLSVDGSRKKLTPEQRAARQAKRKAKRDARKAKHQAKIATRKSNRAARKAKHQAKIATRRSKKSSFEGNTNLDLGFDGNTNLDLSFDGNTNLDLGFDGNTNLDLSFDGSVMKKHFRQRPQIEVSQDGLDLGFNGGALEEDFHGGGDMLYFDGSDEMSNAIGSWIKKQKEKAAIKKVERKDKKEVNKIVKAEEKKIREADRQQKREAREALSREKADVLANKNKVVFTEDEMVDIYKSSGSSKPFSEWTKGEGAKNFFNSIAQFGAAFLQKKSQESAGVSTDDGSGVGSDETSGGGSGGDNAGEKKILGMNPVTFTIVAVGVGLLAIGGIYLASRGKGTPTPSPLPVG